MVKESAAEGVMISLTPQGGISLKGDSEAVGRWSAVLKSRKPELIAYLIEESVVVQWLVSIEETEQEQVDEVINRCRQDPEALPYFLWRAAGGD